MYGRVTFALEWIHSWRVVLSSAHEKRLRVCVIASSMMDKECSAIKACYNGLISTSQPCCIVCKHASSVKVMTGVSQLN